METKNLNIYAGKEIRIYLKNTYNYTGQIIEFLDGAITFRDKFNNIVLISLDEIATITELKRGVE